MRDHEGLAETFANTATAVAKGKPCVCSFFPDVCHGSGSESSSYEKKHTAMAHLQFLHALEFSACFQHRIIGTELVLLS